MSFIQPIQTNYAGYRMRSRLEARWAYFFDLCELKWEYEPEAFDLGANGRYLPDFKIHTKEGPSLYYEIKHRYHGDSHKAKALDELNTLQSALTLSGDPLDVLDTHDMCPYCGTIEPGGNWYDCGHGLMERYCWVCDTHKPQGISDTGLTAIPGIAGFQLYHRKGQNMMTLVECHRFNEKLEEFAIAARQRQFGFGRRQK